MAITPESFEALLAWLDPDRETAGRLYETIRAGLVRMFISRGCCDAEHLADVTIDRVCGRMPELAEAYEGDPARYFHGVARNVLLEYHRRKEVTVDVFPTAVSEAPSFGPEHDCLRKCLLVLAPDKRELMLDYYLYKKKAKVAYHKSLAKERGVTEAGLRVQIHRLRVALYNCVLSCMKGLAAETNTAPRDINKRELASRLPYRRD